MSDTADWLVESVFPEGVAVRQWVLSMPWKLRYLAAKDAKLKRRALKIFLEEVFGLLRRLSGAGRGSQGGAVTAVQRFGSALNLNVHFHSLVLDGMYEGARFRRGRAPLEGELQELVERVGAKIVKMARRCAYEVDLEKGMGGQEEEEPSVFETVQAASIKGMLAFPTPQGHYRRVKLLGKREYEPERSKAGCARWGGFSVHANVRIGGKDRRGLAQLCGYVLRPPFSTERLEVDVLGQVVYQLRKPRADGATHLVMQPVEFMEKLAALVPPPRAHLVHYHGVLGPNSGWRKRGQARGAASGATKPEAGVKKRRRPWAELLQKTFGVEVLRCARCGGRMKLIAMIRSARVAAKILGAMGWDVAEMEAQSRWRQAAGLDPPAEEGREWDSAVG